ncbi:hypothetical protein GCM10009535_26950 [Streptomyces thermocarboxydovorans]|uniref:Integral membrane protein n=1 Tax=Streptomyces thermocarboxydovorans TaxID=59298 RepID=A0ABN1HGQ3_9ACTN
MTRAAKDITEGVITFAVGLVLKLTTEDVEVPVCTLTKVGAVMMCVGGALLLWGLIQQARPARWRPFPASAPRPAPTARRRSPCWRCGPG